MYMSIWRPEDNLQELALSSYHGDSRDQTQVIMLSGFSFQVGLRGVLELSWEQIPSYKYSKWKSKSPA